MSDLKSILISNFRGLNRQSRPTEMGMEWAAAALNVDHSRDSLRPRDSIAKTNFLDTPVTHVADPVRILVMLHRLDGTKHMVWIQGDDIFATQNPRILGAAAASGTQLDSALTATTYPQKFRGPATIYHGVELDGTIYLVNGQDAPLRWSPETGLIRWSIYQPRSLVYGGPGLWSAPGNFVHQDAMGVGAPGAEFAYGPLIYAFTWYNARTGDESNPSPLFDFSNAPLITPYAPNLKVGRITFSVDRPYDAQVTHARFYRCLSGGTANDLRRMATVPIPPAGKVGFGASVSTSGHIQRYGDAALLNTAPLEFDHYHVPPLAVLIQHSNYLMGAMRWEERFLPGRPAIPGGNATCTTTTAFGYVVTIVPGASGFRVNESMAGNMTIRFPTGADRPYRIMDVNEAAQTLLIGMNIGDPFLVLPNNFDALDAADENLAAGSTFILEAPKNRWRWSKRALPSYWPGFNSRPIGKNDGQEINSAWVSRDVVVIGKPDRLYSLLYESSPAPGDGRVRLLSETVGCSGAHAYASRDGYTEFQHTSGIYVTDGGPPQKVSVALGLNVMVAGGISIHYRRKRCVLHFAAQSGDGQGAFVHFYETGKWARWEWRGRTFAAALADIDADDIDRVFLSTTDGFHFCFFDTMGDTALDGVGIADGHASMMDSQFFPRSRCTATAPANNLIDSSTRFPDHATTGASVIGDPIRIISGTGAGQFGVIATRVSDMQITITWDPSIASPVALDATSEYEIGYVEWYWRTPWQRIGSVAHTQKEVHPFYVPKAYTGLGDRFRHDKRLEIRVVEGFPATSTTAFDFKEVRRGEQRSIDPVTGIPLVEADPEHDRFLIDYTNSTYPQASSPVSPARMKMNPGHAHAPLHAQASYIQTQIGETGTKIKGEMTAIEFVVVPMEAQ